MPRSTNKPVVNNSAIQNRPHSNEQPTLFSSIKQGFGFGVGSSIAHNIFDSKPVKPHTPLHPVTDKVTEFKQCMEKTYNNYEECVPILK